MLQILLNTCKSALSFLDEHGEKGTLDGYEPHINLASLIAIVTFLALTTAPPDNAQNASKKFNDAAVVTNMKDHRPAETAVEISGSVSAPCQPMTALMRLAVDHKFTSPGACL
jgi:hypothetical protein